MSEPQKISINYLGLQQYTVVFPTRLSELERCVSNILPKSEFNYVYVFLLMAGTVLYCSIVYIVRVVDFRPYYSLHTELLDNYIFKKLTINFS
jgi:hypothetical protein